MLTNYEKFKGDARGSLQEFQPFIQHTSPMGERRLSCAGEDRENSTIQNVGYKGRAESKFR